MSIQALIVLALMLSVSGLIVAVGLSFDDELAEARSLLSLEVYIGVAATALLIALNLLLVREIRRRNQRELELAQEHAALESARWPAWAATTEPQPRRPQLPTSCLQDRDRAPGRADPAGHVKRHGDEQEIRPPRPGAGGG